MPATLHATRVRRDNSSGRARNSLITLALRVASLVLYGSVMSNMNRLETIADRQRRTRVLDLAFAALVVFAGAGAMMGVTEAVRAATVQIGHK